MADIPTLRKERAPHRRLVTLTAKKAKDIISTGDINSEQVTQLRAYLSMLKNRLPKLEEYDSRIATQITDDEELDKEVEEANNYQIYTYVSIEEIEEALRPKVDVVPKSEIPVPTTDESITERSRAQVKLPKVNIDPFDGEIPFWPEKGVRSLDYPVYHNFVGDNTTETGEPNDVNGKLKVSMMFTEG